MCVPIEKFTGGIFCVNCLEGMQNMPDNSVDSIITDPPYALEFMGKDWDKVLPGVDIWREALRVAKPGSVLMAFGGTRTFHRLAVNIEDAGWEIRDCMMWLYGSGFPKSHNISKAIDKAAGAEREVVGEKTTPDGKAYSCRTPNSSGEYNSQCSHNSLCGKTRHNNLLTAPATSEAQLWDGWGTALKPAWEPIIVAMKPIEGTFAQNALKWGVAGLWIDGGRIQGETIRTIQGQSTAQQAGDMYGGKDQRDKRLFENTSGRWPANVVLDEEAGELLDRQSGYSTSSGGGGRKKRGVGTGCGIYGKYGPKDLPKNVGLGDSGGASRFFYCAKAGKKERNQNLPDGKTNRHPTVKPIKLMEYLCKLTKTPTSGVVLDPFCGSGSTLVAAQNTGRGFIGFDLDPESVQIAKHRTQTAEKVA